MTTFSKVSVKKEFVWVNWTKEQILKIPAEITNQKRQTLEEIKKVPKDERLVDRQ